MSNDLLTPANNVSAKEEAIHETVQEQTSIQPEEVKQEEKVVKPVPTKQPSEFDGLGALGEFAKSLDEQIELATKPVQERQKDKVDIKDLLKDIKVDLTSIELSSGSLFNLQRTENLFKDKKVFQVVCCQSAYTAYMSALNNQELQNLQGSEEDFYSYRKRIAKLVYKHTEDTSIGKLTFPQWQQLTSYFDFDTLLYGLYCSTFPQSNTYNVRCQDPNCGHRFTTEINNGTLVEVRGKDGIFDQVKNVLDQVRNPEDCAKKSLVQKTKRIICEESKIIIDIKIPSMQDYLEGVLSKIKPEMADEYSTSVGLALFIDKLYVPDLAKLKDEGKLAYFEITDLEKIVMYIANMSFEDAESVTDEINEFTERYKVTYSLKNIVCPECGNVRDEIMLDMEQLIFHTLYTIRERKEKKS